MPDRSEAFQSAPTPAAGQNGVDLISGAKGNGVGVTGLGMLSVLQPVTPSSPEMPHAEYEAREEAAAHHTKPPSYARLLYDFPPENPDEIDGLRGDVLELIGETGEWVTAESSANGNARLCPVQLH